MPQQSQIDKLNIENRANNWVKKVQALYSFIESSLVDFKDIECKSTNSMVMNEELMQKFDVPPKNIPILDLYKQNKLLSTFKPVGLWIVGANGRIDILTHVGAYMLIDTSSVNDNNAAWKVFSPTNRKKGEDFDSDYIVKFAKSL